MKKIKAALALVLLLALALAATGCGAQSLIIGSWVDDTQSLTMQLGKDGQAIVTAYNFPLEVTYTYEGDVLTIEGVGVLKFKNFTLAPAFDRLLNPQGHERVRIKPARRLDWALWVGIAAIGIAAVYGGREFLLLYPEAPEAAAVTEIPAASDSFGTVEAPDALVEAPPTERSVAGVSAAQAGGAASGASVPDAAPEPEIAETHPAQEQDAPTALLSGRHYVVLGVFSTEENARRAVRETEARESALRCRIYRFGGKFMVSPFSSDDAGACAQFIRVQDGRFPDMWTYTAR